jgi:predicted GIY-YIG superfamily endonuclease
MRYVYLLQSTSHPGEHYVGITANFQERLKQHNSSSSPHTKKYQPWRPIVVVRFEDDAKAEAFERYLKSGSGHAFARRHFC